MIKKLDAFRGRLSAAQVAEGINAANRNAVRLAKDAAHLLSADSFPTAASLAILSIEEAGKVSILRSLALSRSDAEIIDAWKEYRSHTRKNVAWILPDLVAAGARKLGDLHALYDENSDHPFVLDQLKQLGFYTDCLGKARWSFPPDIITEELANSLVKTAQVLARDKTCTEREIELWIEHIGPVWKQDAGWMKQALVNWYSAMQAAGLAPEGVNEMDQFIRLGILPGQ